MTRCIEINNRLDDCQTEPEAKLAPFVKSLVQKKVGNSKATKASLYWHASYFALDRLKIWAALNEESRNNILRKLNQTMLEEAFYIEKSGMTYTAKMSLLAESNDEQSLYAMLAADEAVHFQMISRFLLQKPQSYRQQPFLLLLDEVVHNGSFSALIFIAQVLLEGWGLSHYMSLLKNSQCPQLSHLLRLILNDEAVHHGSGIVMSQKHPLEGESLDMVKDILVRFFSMVAAGPVRVAAALATEVGDRGPQQFVDIFAQMQAEEQIQANLGALSKLITEHAANTSLHQFVDSQKLNRAVNAQQFAVTMMEAMR